jgi:hypothetical protein
VLNQGLVVHTKVDWRHCGDSIGTQLGGTSCEALRSCGIDSSDVGDDRGTTTGDSDDISKNSITLLNGEKEPFTTSTADEEAINSAIKLEGNELL